MLRNGISRNDGLCDAIGLILTDFVLESLNLVRAIARFDCSSFYNSDVFRHRSQLQIYGRNLWLC
jgi:hypothetical protein